MAQQLLDLAQPSPTVEHVGGKRVTQHVWRELRVEPGFHQVLLQEPFHGS